MKLIDALEPLGIPAGTTCDAIAAYIDHNANPQSFQQAVARFPNAIHLRITAVTCDPAADIIDGEQGTGITPAMAAQWALKKRAKGEPFVIYCNENLTNSWGWAAYKAAVQAVGIDPATVLWWTADYDGVATLRPGEWARQYTDLDQNGQNTYDTSITATSWPPGAPTTPAPLPEEPVTIIAQIMNGASISGYGLIDSEWRKIPLSQPHFDAIMACRKTMADAPPLQPIALAAWNALPAAADETAQIASLSGQVAGLTSAVKQIAGGGNVDLAVVTAAAKAGAEEALSGIQITVTKGTTT